jgi:hypothetical protein
MEGRGDNPMTFGKKSSPFGVSFVNPWRLSLPISQATKGAAMQCSFLAIFLNLASMQHSKWKSTRQILGFGLFFHIIIATLVVKINDSYCFLVENSI